MPQREDYLDLINKDGRSRIVTSFHCGDFLYGSASLFSLDSNKRKKYFLSLNRNSNACYSNLTAGFGQKATGPECELLLSETSSSKLSQILRTGNATMLLFCDVPPGLNEAIEVKFLNRHAWFSIGPAILALVNRVPLLPLINYSTGNSSYLKLGSQSASSLVMVHFGFFLVGFASGMGLLAITAVIVLYLKFAPTLQYTLDPNDPDRNGGIKRLGDSLWFFGGLIGAVSVLVSIYMFGVSWTFIHKQYVQFIFLFWVSLPYIFAVSLVLIPGLSVRRRVSNFKSYKSVQLKLEKVKLYLSYKQFESKEDEEIISEKKELGNKLGRIQNELEALKRMRNSHIDGKDSD
jgi:uncharacterized membrane protein